MKSALAMMRDCLWNHDRHAIRISFYGTAYKTRYGTKHGKPPNHKQQIQGGAGSWPAPAQPNNKTCNKERQPMGTHRSYLDVAEHV